MQHVISQVLPDLSSDMDGPLTSWLNVHNWSRLVTGSFTGVIGSRCRVLTARGYSWPYLPTQVTFFSEPDLLISSVSHWTLPPDHELQDGSNLQPFTVREKKFLNILNLIGTVTVRICRLLGLLLTKSLKWSSFRATSNPNRQKYHFFMELGGSFR
jgi:hypothetical protein